MYFNYRNLILLLFYAFVFNFLDAQEGDDNGKINTFSGAVTVQNKGISTIPNLTLGKPAVIFDMRVGRKLTFEPQFRFSLEGKPWAMVFWWRYNTSIGSRFRMNISANHSLSFKTIENTSSGTPQENIRTTRYLAGAVTPSLQFNRYAGLGMYLFYTRGIEEFITRNTWMVSLRPVISNISVTKNIFARFGPEIYYLKMDDNDGMFLNAGLSVNSRNFPLSVSALLNKTLKSDIPSEYSFLWNVGLTYTFSKEYLEKR